MLEYINQIRTNLGIPINPIEKERGIKGNKGFYWGFPDGFNELSENTKVYYEIEYGQNHPNTNVLKYWPILEENEALNIILIQWIIKKPKSKNRWELSKFIGDKMEKTFPKRFTYCFLEYEERSNINELNSIRTHIQNIR